MIFRMLFVRLGIPHMLFLLSLLPWVLFNAQLLHCLQFLLIRPLYYALFSLTINLGFSRMLYLRCWPGWSLLNCCTFLRFHPPHPHPPPPPPPPPPTPTPPPPLYSCLITPWSQLAGMTSELWTLLITSRKIFLVSASYSINTSFGISFAPKSVLVISRLIVCLHCFPDMGLSSVFECGIIVSLFSLFLLCGTLILFSAWACLV